LDGIAVIMSFIVLVFLKDNGAHESAGRAAAGEQLELGKSLLGEDVESV
jgi:hypothetical protein